MSATSSTTVTVRNVAPTATFTAPATATVGMGFTLTMTSPSDASAADAAAGVTYAFDCGDGSGYGVFAAAASRACPAPTTAGARTVRGKIRDRDGGDTEYTRTLTVGVTYDAVCKIVRSFSSKRLVADLTCAELATVEAESGHAFTRAEADALIDLMERL
jgi:hypothetical protein